MNQEITEVTEQPQDFTTQWIFAQYEAGRSVSEIAAEIGLSENTVYAKMRVQPKTYDQIKTIREEKYCRRLRRVRGLADTIALDYLERLHSKIQNAATDAEKDALYDKIDEVLKIAKQYGDRVQLAEGKLTANIGNGSGLPFKIVVTETYETTTKSTDFTD